MLRRLAVERLLGAPSSLAFEVDGAPSALGAISRRDVRDFRRAAYRPSRSTVIVVGATSVGEVEAAVRRSFGTWREPDVPIPPVPVEPSPRESGHVLGIDLVANRENVMFDVAGSCTGLRDPDDATFEVIAMLFDRYHGSHAVAQLRIETGESYVSHANCDERRTGGTFLLTFDAAPGDAGEVLARARGELDRLATSGPSVEELEAAKARYMGIIAGRLATNEGLAAELARFDEAELEPSFLSTLASRVRSVDVDGVVAVARRYLSSSTIAAWGDPKELNGALDGLGQIRWHQLEPAR
jgi:zinc protease